MKRIAFFMTCIFFASYASGGSVHLNNGDIYSGELVNVDKHTITWKSDVLGEIKIPKRLIAKLESSTALKIIGQKDPCQWQALDGSKAVLRCAGGSSQTVSILSLRDVTPYEYASREHAGKVQVVGTQTTGNVRSADWLISLQTNLRYGDFRHNIDAAYTSKFVEPRRTSDQDPQRFPVIESINAHYSLDGFVSAKRYWFGDVEVLRDEAKGIQEQYNIGAGLGYQFWENKRSALSIETGGRQTKELFEPGSVQRVTTEQRREFASWRLALDLRYALPLNINFYQRSEFLTSLRDGDDWDLQTDTGFDVPVGFGITADVLLEYDYDNLPPVDIENDNTQLRIGLGYTW